METDLKRVGGRRRRPINTALQAAASRLPASLRASVNEAYLLHGTSPEVVLSLLSDGVNERFSGGIFGHGNVH
jgi:hypothetical protein